MTGEEWQKVDKIIKDSVKNGKKSVVRRMLDKSMSYGDALTVLTAFRADTGKSTRSAEKGLVRASTGLQSKDSAGIQGMDNLDEIQGENNQLDRVDGEVIPKDGSFDMDLIKDRIQSLITSFCDTYDIQDLTKAPQRQFTALSTYIGDNLFKGNRILWDKTPVDNGSAMAVYNYMYDWDIVACMISFYITMCNLYNKAFLFDGIAGFLHMSENTLKDNNDKLTARGIDIYKKHEDMLSAGIIDGKQSPVGILAHLNHYHGWTTGQTHTEKKETIVMYPALSMHQDSPTPQITTTETKQVL